LPDSGRDFFEDPARQAILPKVLIATAREKPHRASLNFDSKPRAATGATAEKRLPKIFEADQISSNRPLRRLPFDVSA
jgi:hypothetical protein